MEAEFTMREVRMTFGEHLEELRSRIIMSLVWLGVSLGVSFFFGDTFMEVTLEPHNRAIRGALNSRMHVKLMELLPRFDELERSGAEGKKWDLLFTREIQRVATEKTSQRIKSMVDALEEALPVPVDPELRQRQDQGFNRFGDELAAAILALNASEVSPLDDRDYVEKFERFHRRIEEISRTLEPSEIQKSLGLGKSFANIEEVVEKFLVFLRARRLNVREAYRALDGLQAVQQQARAIREDPAARDTLVAIENLHDDCLESIEDFGKREAAPTILTRYQEGFMSYFKVVLIFALFFALPLILYEIWKFVGAGLYEHEQKYVLIFLPFSIALFVSGNLFGFFWMVPFGLEFLASWGASYSELLFSLGSYIGLFFTLTILLGLVFQTPLVMIFLYQIGVVTPAGFAAVRKYTLLAAVIFSTIVTPPDPLSWAMMAGPIMVLYELGIRICSFLERRKKKSAASPG